MYVVLRHSAKSFVPVAGINKLDEPREITCRSPAGCLLSIEASVLVSIGRNRLCVYSLLDDHKVKPPCLLPQQISSGYLSPRQSTTLAQGKHVVRTVVSADGAGAAKVFSWEIDYTIYEKSQHQN